MSLSGPERLFAWIGNNAVQIDTEGAELQLRELSPILLQEGERVEMAFKIERDHFYFTTERVLFRNKKAVTGQKVNYKSLPYSSIKAFSVQSAGEMLDADSELRIWSTGLGKTVMNFVKGRVDIYAVQRFFNAKVLRGAAETAYEQARAAPPPEAARSDGKLGEFLNLLGDDARQIDAAAAEEQLKRDPPVLAPDERIELAFKCGRDSTLLTSKRILIVDVKGFSGKKVEYRSILWKAVRAFSVETAGAFLDRDAEMKIWTNMEDMRVIGQDLRKGKADIMAIQRFFSDKLLGADTVPMSAEAVSLAGHTDTGPQRLSEWIGDDARQIDARQADQQFHACPPLLQGCEHVEMAFKGRRDMTLFTTKRLLILDVKGWSGKKVKYLSVPWTTVQAFAVRSAGAMFDKDSEMMIWTDIMHEPKQGDDPPEPGMSYLEQDFRKDRVDLMAVHRYLSARCLAAAAYQPAGVAVSPEVLQASPPTGVDSFLSWLGDDARQVDPREVDRQLHTVNPMLQSDEQVVMAFKVGRDMTCFTTKRALLIDVQGWTGSKVEYKSVPYTSLRAFSVESAGSWDRDAEVKLFIKAPWMPRIQQDLRKGRADVIAIQAFLAAQVFGSCDGSPALAAPAGGEDPRSSEEGVAGFLRWLGDDARQISAAEVDKSLHTSPVILQSDEGVDMAFKVGRDMYVFTTKRILLIDVQGLTGKKVEYMSIPLKYCAAFAVQSAGKFDWDEEAIVYTDVPGKKRISQDLWKGKADLFAVQSLLAHKILGR